MQSMDEDQRDAPRVDVLPDLSILQTSDGERFIGIVYNISRSGALLDVSQNVGSRFNAADGEILEFVSTPGYLRTALDGVRCRIVRRKSGCWGVRFERPLSVSQVDLDQIQYYLEVPDGAEWSKY